MNAKNARLSAFAKLSFIFIAFSYLAGCSPVAQNLVTDEVMEKRFTENKGKFEELIKLFNGQTATKQVGYGPRAFRAQEEALDAATLGKIKALLKELQINGGITQTQMAGETILVVQQTGSALGGKDKAYAYRKEPPPSTQPSLDTAKIPRGMGALYKHLVENWYLYLEYDD